MTSNVNNETLGNDPHYVLFQEFLKFKAYNTASIQQSNNTNVEKEPVTLEVTTQPITPNVTNPVNTQSLIVDQAIELTDLVIDPVIDKPPELLEVFNDIYSYVSKCNSMPEHYRRVMTAYAISSYFNHLATITPLLIFTAPEPNCGKSQALNTMENLVCDAFKLSGGTVAAFHNEYINHENGCMLVDDFDSVPKARKEQVIEKLIQGYMVGNPFKKCLSNGDIIEINTFGTKILAMNGNDLPEAMLSRSFTIHCQRKAVNEVVQDPLTTSDAKVRQLREKIEWCTESINYDIAKALQTVQLPNHPKLHDRSHNNWKMMRIVARHASPEWFSAIEKAMEMMDAVHEELSLNLRVLIDVKAIIDHCKETDARHKCLPSKQLYMKLQSLRHSEWKKQTSIALGKVLRAYAINPKHSIYYNGKQTIGIKFDDLESIFNTYVISSDTDICERYEYVKNMLKYK